MALRNWGRAEYAEAYEHGATIKDIAMITGKRYSTIHYHLTKAKVVLRTRTQHLKEKQ